MDKQLEQIAFYQQYPQYMPFIGESFSKTGILLLGESHFFDAESLANHDPEAWYKNTAKTLKEGEIKRTNTRLVVNEFTKTKSRRAMFGRIDKALKDSIDVNGTNYDGIQNIAFMNAFQRPAVGNGKSIKVFDIDVEQSANVINQVISIIKPKHLCFVSKKAYKRLSKEITFDSIHVVVHPCSAWWYRKTKKGTNGKEAFTKLLAKKESS